MNKNTKVILSFIIFWLSLYLIITYNYSILWFILEQNSMMLNIIILYFGINMGMIIERVKNNENHKMLDWLILFFTGTAVFIVANVYILLVEEVGGFDDS